MGRSIIFFSVVLLGLFVGACQVTTTTPGDGSSGGSGSSITGTEKLVLAITGEWAGSSDVSTTHTCTVEASAAKGSTTTCTWAVEEGALFYSDFTFELTTGSGACQTIRFLPYFYKVADAAGFVPAWTTDGSAIDCSADDYEIDADCFSGPGPSIISAAGFAFPLIQGIIYHPDGNSRTYSWDMTSANTNRRASNRWMSNNLVNTGANLNSAQLLLTGDSYVGGTIQNWSWLCLDEYQDPMYQLDLVITDANGPDGDQIDEWLGN